MTALAGATEIHLVVHGKYTLVDMGNEFYICYVVFAHLALVWDVTGEITDEVVIAIAAVIIVAAMLHFHVKGAFCTGLVFGTLLWWFLSGTYYA
jgi:hypothetical protein